MTTRVPLVLMVVWLGRVLAVPTNPIPAFQLPSENAPPTTPSPATSKSPSMITKGPSISWNHPGPGPRLGPRMTLSLDVPLGLLQILLEQAQSRAARERAAANARILARVGRR
ncbi:urocortin-2 [Perognathus longimembris pacificus]|uniref:urocortin-2 n=1 Tax=Perognathus longimembris pacificus TaxID=214514 RepID=UPI0020194D82|nr:urocortin-2 [Perognathus longimembris pacificus]